MRYCEQCGSQVYENDKFCSYCGSSINNKSEIINNETPNSYDTTNNQPGLAFGIVGIILGPFGLIFQLIGRFPFFLISVAGIILAEVGLSKARQLRKTTNKKAIGTMVTSIIGIASSIYFTVFSAILFLSFIFIR
ncbi:zinc-ribbon domain-containing protein [Acholeplasma sp. OttesenSCG-928-E16]|nr:zinc-ribbon domain-containing protein [Acholeplasma sp. OttesenSCG-928-E16]